MSVKVIWRGDVAFTTVGMYAIVRDPAGGYRMTVTRKGKTTHLGYFTTRSIAEYAATQDANARTR